MDIQVASNFERYLYYFFDEKAEKVRQAMEDFRRNGRLTFLRREERERIGSDFLAQTVDREQTLATIRAFYRSTGAILDPHTAVGVHAGRRLAGGDAPVVCLATAHAAKFPDAVRQAIGRDPEIPSSLAGIENRPRRCEIIEAETGKIKDFLAGNAL